MGEGRAWELGASQKGEGVRVCTHAVTQRGTFALRSFGRAPPPLQYQKTRVRAAELFESLSPVGILMGNSNSEEKSCHQYQQQSPSVGRSGRLAVLSRAFHPK